MDLLRVEIICCHFYYHLYVKMSALSMVRQCISSNLVKLNSFNNQTGAGFLVNTMVPYPGPINPMEIHFSTFILWKNVMHSYFDFERRMTYLCNVRDECQRCYAKLCYSKQTRKKYSYIFVNTKFLKMCQYSMVNSDR